MELRKSDILIKLLGIICNQTTIILHQSSNIGSGILKSERHEKKKKGND